MPESVATSGWTRVAFGDVVRQVRDRVDPEHTALARYVAGQHMDTDDLRIRRWGLLGDGYLGPAFHMRFKPGHVLYGSRRTYLRKVAVADFEGITANTTFVIESRDPKILLPELLPFIMQTESFHAHSIMQSKGSVNPYINFSDLTWYEFTLPPLEEQRRLASTLTAVRNEQDSYIRTSSALGATMQALTAAALIQLQESMASSRLEDWADIRYGLTVNPERRKATEQIPYLRVANVMRDKFVLTELKTVGKGRDDDVYRLEAGDVLVVEGHADVAQIGRAAMWDGQISEMYHQNHLIRVRCGDRLDPEYLCLLANSFHGQSYIRSHAKSSSGLNTINSTVVKEYRVPVPTRDTQARIVAKAKMGAHLMEEISKRHDDLTRIWRGVLGPLEGACL